MSEFFDYQEIACPRCGRLNRRFRSPLLHGRYTSQCDYCGVELATGRFSAPGFFVWVMLNAAAWFFCSLIGVIAAVLSFQPLGLMFLGGSYDAHRSRILTLALAVGIAGGIAVAERNRRRGGLFGPMRVARGSPEARLPPGAVPRAASVEVGPDPPDARAAVIRKTARAWYLGLGFFAGAILGLGVLPRVLGALGLPDWVEPVKGISMVAGLLAGWAWGRWKHPAPGKRRDPA